MLGSVKKKELIIVGDRVLVRPEAGEGKTQAGLILPANAVENQPVQGGWIEEVGPGTPIPDPNLNEDEPWKVGTGKARYVPMQARPGDYAIFMRKAAVEIQFEGKDYLIVPQAAVLLLVREGEEIPDGWPG